MLLKDVAKLRTGLVLGRKADDHNPKYRYPLLNMRVFSENSQLDLNELDVFGSSVELPSHYFTKPGDVVVKLARPQVAAVIDRSTQGILVSAAFMIVTELKASFDPWFIAWFLNSDAVARCIMQVTGSNMLGTARVSAYEPLELPDISCEKQHEIAELYRLHHREVQLTNELLRLKQRRCTAAISKLLAT